MDRDELLEQARAAARHAYAPYSHFRVGAAVVVETPEGQLVVTGANVENASYGLTLCAERAALAAACQLGEPEPVKVAKANMIEPKQIPVANAPLADFTAIIHGGTGSVNIIQADKNAVTSSDLAFKPRIENGTLNLQGPGDFTIEVMDKPKYLRSNLIHGIRELPVQIH